MALPNGWHLIRVFGQFLLINGQPAVGTISFRSDQQVVINGVEVVPYVQSVTLDATGSFEIHLAATDDPNIAPTGWAYQATFDFSAGTPPDPFYFPVAWDGGDLNLVNARHVVPPAPTVSYLTTADIGAVVASQGSVVAAEADAQAALAECATQAQEIASLQAAQATALLQGNNLSDVADAATARTNLGVPAGSGTSTGTNTGDQDLSGYVPTSRTVNGHPLTANVTVTSSDLGLGTASALTADTDGTLAANSDTRVATQKATKTYINASVAAEATARTAADNAITASLAPGAVGTAMAVGDANATIPSGTVAALLTVALTASRTYTLPAASAYSAGTRILWADMAGSLSGSLTATIAPNGTDTINGGASFVLADAYGQANLVSDGTSRWTVRRIGPRVQIDTFAASGTWVKQPWALEIEPMLWGPGGAGGSGRRGAAGTVRCGGGGGSSGAFSSAILPASAVGATETVTIGAAGTPGAAVTTDNTNGNSGTTGSATTFGAWLRAATGYPGQGGTSSTGTGGQPSAGTSNGAPGGSASTSGGSGLSGGNGIGNCSGGAGSGGGITSADSPSAGGPGGAANGITQSNPVGGVVPGGNGANGGTNTAAMASSGPGGGAASITGAAGAGGSGFGAGAPGAGGGASLNGNNSGAGGTPAPGLCIIIQRG